jgi:hypothetical protein
MSVWAKFKKGSWAGVASGAITNDGGLEGIQFPKVTSSMAKLGAHSVIP